MLAGWPPRAGVPGRAGQMLYCSLFTTYHREALVNTSYSPHSALTEVCPRSRGRGIEPSSQQRPVSYYIVRRACGLGCWLVPELWKRPLTAPASVEPAASVSRSFCLHLVSVGSSPTRRQGSSYSLPWGRFCLFSYFPFCKIWLTAFVWCPQFPCTLSCGGFLHFCGVLRGRDYMCMCWVRI